MQSEIILIRLSLLFPAVLFFDIHGDALAPGQVLKFRVNLRVYHCITLKLLLNWHAYTNSFT